MTPFEPGSMRRTLRDLEVFAGELPVFDPGTTPAEPAELFAEWLGAALDAGVREPHAMTLSTVDAQGRPSARVLILKNVDLDGWQFAAHATSPKGRDLTERGEAALTFYWSPQTRQVRVRGPVVAEPAGASAEDFLARSAGARAEALLGLQSTPLEDPATRDARTRESLARIERDPGLVPPEWTLFTLRARQVEFWQGKRGRDHTRLAYTWGDASAQGDGPAQGGGAWAKELLWP